MRHAPAAWARLDDARGPSNWWALALLSCSACAPDAFTEARGASIVGGRAEAGYEAVGYLLEGADPESLERACSATAIRSRAAVTAAHCLVGVKAAGIGFGDGGDEHVARSIVIHPSFESSGAERYRHDVAVLLFDSDLGVDPAVTRMAQAGVLCRTIGYGRTTPGGFDLDDGYTDERKSAGQRIESVDRWNIYTGGTDGGLCWGDSGSPLMVEGTNEILGVLSDFDRVFDCHAGNRMIFTSLAAERSFLASALHENDPACEYWCEDYRYAAGQCVDGWSCDGACISYTGCS